MFSLQVKWIKPCWNSSWRKKELQTCMMEKQKLWVFSLLLLLFSSLLSLGLWYFWDLKEVRSSFQPSLVIRGRKWPEMLLSLRCNKEHLKMISCYFWMYIKYLHAVYDPIGLSQSSHLNPFENLLDVLTAVSQDKCCPCTCKVKQRTVNSS